MAPFNSATANYTQSRLPIVAAPILAIKAQAIKSWAMVIKGLGPVLSFAGIRRFSPTVSSWHVGQVPGAPHLVDGQNAPIEQLGFSGYSAVFVLPESFNRARIKLDRQFAIAQARQKHAIELLLDEAHRRQDSVALEDALCRIDVGEGCLLHV